MTASRTLLVSYLDDIYLNSDYRLDINRLEKLYDHIDAQKLKFSEFIKILTETQFWKNVADNRMLYKNLCYKLALEIDDSVLDIQNQPAYHSISHFIDVCISISLLCIADTTIGKHTKTEYWILLLCAIGHDYGHDGSFNSMPQQLEKKSLGLIRQFLDRQAIDDYFKSTLMAKIETIILATDPTCYPILFNKFSHSTESEPQSMDYLCQLLVEADLLASLLPNRGLVLSKRLSQEWADKNPVASATVISKAGRFGFLNFVQILSPQAKCLGIDQIQQLSKDQSV